MKELHRKPSMFTLRPHKIQNRKTENELTTQNTLITTTENIKSNIMARTTKYCSGFIVSVVLMLVASTSAIPVEGDNTSKFSTVGQTFVFVYL